MPSKAPRPDFSLFLYSEGSPQTAAGGPRLPQAPAPHRPPSTPPDPFIRCHCVSRALVNT